ncbi:MAG: hypothetical protein ACJATT_003806 [Myxococcota bacterium]
MLGKRCTDDHLTLRSGARPGWGPLQGPVELELRLYDAGTSGTELWRNSYQTQAVDGYIHITLENGTPTLTTSVFDHAQVWLELEVGTGAPLARRTRLSSVPYALHAERAGQADRALPADSALTADSATLADGVVVAIGTASGSCIDGALGLDPSTAAFRVCHNSA